VGRIFISVLIAGLGIGFLVWFVSSPPPPPATLEAGLACVDRSDAAGIERIEQALRKQGHEDEAIILQCAWLAQRDRYEEVLKQLPERLADSPLRRQYLRLMGESLYRIGNTEHAEIVLSKSVAEFPDEVESWRHLALVYYNVARDDQAMASQLQIQKLAPDDFRPHQLAALILVEKEDFAGAAGELQAALEKGPPAQIRTDLRAGLARCLMRQSQYADAVTLLDQESNSPEASALQANCYWALGDKLRAGLLARDVLSLEPANLSALRVKAQQLRDQDKRADAAEILKRIISAEPFDMESRTFRVQLLDQLGLAEERDQEQAEQARYQGLIEKATEYRKIALAEPDAPAPRWELVQTYRAMGRVQLAERWQRGARYCEARLKRRGGQGPLIKAVEPSTGP